MSSDNVQQVVRIDGNYLKRAYITWGHVSEPYSYENFPKKLYYQRMANVVLLDANKPFSVTYSRPTDTNWIVSIDRDTGITLCCKVPKILDLSYQVEIATRAALRRDFGKSEQVKWFLGLPPLGVAIQLSIGIKDYGDHIHSIVSDVWKIPPPGATSVAPEMFAKWRPPSEVAAERVRKESLKAAAAKRKQESPAEPQEKQKEQEKEQQQPKSAKRSKIRAPPKSKRIEADSITPTEDDGGVELANSRQLQEMVSLLIAKMDVEDDEEDLAAQPISTLLTRQDSVSMSGEVPGSPCNATLQKMIEAAAQTIPEIVLPAITSALATAPEGTKDDKNIDPYEFDDMLHEHIKEPTKRAPDAVAFIINSFRFHGVVVVTAFLEKLSKKQTEGFQRYKTALSTQMINLDPREFIEIFDCNNQLVYPWVWTPAATHHIINSSLHCPTYFYSENASANKVATPTAAQAKSCLPPPIVPPPLQPNEVSLLPKPGFESTIILGPNGLTN